MIDYEHNAFMDFLVRCQDSDDGCDEWAGWKTACAWQRQQDAEICHLLVHADEAAKAILNQGKP